MSDRDGNNFVWFLAGLGLGALAGVLYAPRSGRETRQAILRLVRNEQTAANSHTWSETSAEEAEMMS